MVHTSHTLLTITLPTNTHTHTHMTVQVYARAVRNCPWSGPLWEAALRALERTGLGSGGDEAHAALAEQALAAGLQVCNRE